MGAEEGDLQVRGSELPYGAGQQLEAAADSAEDLGDEELDFEDDGDEDISAALDAEPFTPPQLQGPDAILFRPTDRPERPVTTGIKGGPGPDDLPLPGEGSRAFLRRQAGRLSASPTASPDIKVWADRVRRGQ